MVAFDLQNDKGHAENDGPNIMTSTRSRSCSMKLAEERFNLQNDMGHAEIDTPLLTWLYKVSSAAKARHAIYSLYTFAL